MEGMIGAMQCMELRGIIPTPVPGAVARSTPPQQLLCLSIHVKDKIRVMNLPETSRAELSNCIESSWPEGIQSKGPYGIAYQFTLNGSPWQGGGEPAHDALRLMASIFGFLLQRGWVLKIVTNLSKWTWDKDTFYFKQDALPDLSVQVCAMSFNRFDTIRVIGGPLEVVDVVRSCIHNFWPRGLLRDRPHYGSPEFKLEGTPWKPREPEMMQPRMFVGQTIEALDRAGWEVYASIDISDGKGSSNFNIDSLHSWILRTKAPSAPISIRAQAPYPGVWYHKRLFAEF